MRWSRSLPLLLALALAACADQRRDVALRHLEANPPAGFEIVALPATVPFTRESADTAEGLVGVRLRLTRPTVEGFDASTLPAARALDQRLAVIRAWALGALAPDDPLREKFLTRIAAAREGFPVKRIVTPEGTEIEGLATLTLRREGAEWKVASLSWDARVPGELDADPAAPFADAPEVAARFAQLEKVAVELSAERDRVIAARRERAARTRGELLAALREGRAFEGDARRLIVTRGLDRANSAVVVITWLGQPVRTQRLEGSLVERPDGETVWRGAASDAMLHSEPPGLRLVLDSADATTLRPAGRVDLIPDL